MLYLPSAYDDTPQIFGRSWWWFNVPKRIAPWIYFVLFALLAIVSYVVRDYSSQGALAVLRISMGNVLFFTLMALVCLGVSREDDDYHLGFDRRAFHTGCWPYKVMLWALLVGTAFLYPEHVFTVYQYIAWAFAILFVVAQTVIFIDFVYGVNEYMLEKDSCVWNAVLVAITAIFIAVALGGLLALYYFFVPESSCSMNIAFITSTIGLFLVYSLLSISDIRPEYAGLLASSIVFALNAFYTWGALNRYVVLSFETAGEGAMHNARRSGCLAPCAWGPRVNSGSAPHWPLKIGLIASPPMGDLKLLNFREQKLHLILAKRPRKV